MNNVRRFALVFGVIYLVAGIAGFIPPLLTHPADDTHQLRVGAMSGHLLGLFPVNALHSVVHLAIGIWGLAAAKGTSASVTYGRSLAVIYGVLAIMGLIPALSTTFGLVPLYGHDIWLHAGTALIAAYFGFATKPEVETGRV